ncbi:hypothetical protein GCM10009744_06790 [Kribbella alba]|uniref:Uncharacterized protein n=1 Tax=Kribbella alba TaxID=190197 RepID=A0ABN2F0G4_9ACTN
MQYEVSASTSSPPLSQGWPADRWPVLRRLAPCRPLLAEDPGIACRLPSVGWKADRTAAYGRSVLRVLRVLRVL